MSKSGWLNRLVVCFVALSWSAGGVAWAAPTKEQQKEIDAISTLMTKAGNLFQNGKHKEAAEAVIEGQGRLEKIAAVGDDQITNALAPIHKRLTNAHALLELEGVTLPELKPLAALAAKPDPKPAAGGTAPAAGEVSFTKQVVPILNARCGGCHVRKASGMFSMASYAALMKGPPAGLVIFKGDGKGSVLMEKIDDGEMPPSGQKIPAMEIETLRKWITEGAKFDGTDPMADLNAVATAGTPMPATAPMVQIATGKETISFAKDIAPVLSASCMGCHGTNRPRENFSVNTFESLLKGGDAGVNILPGKPAESLLIKKLKGTAADGGRMPLNQPALDNAIIAKFEKWIEEGAKFDGPDAKQAVSELAAITKAINSTHEQLSQDRAALAMQHWNLTLPGDQPARIETTNYLVLGNVGPNTLTEIGDQAEALAPKVAEVFKAPADQPLIKGRLSLLVFRDRYSYSEFGKMVEKRSLPQAWRGHFKFSTVDAYAGVVVPKAGTSQDYSIQGLITQQLAGTYMASLGKGVPHWFADGTGRVVTARLSPGDSRVNQWNEAVPGVVGSMMSSDAFLNGNMEQEAADIAAYSFVRSLMTDSRKFQILVDNLRKGGEFNKTFSEVYGGSPAQLTAAWAPKAATSKPKTARPLPKK
ncbi:c-type cytochrome domain-containing protein [Anatilimnocola sp. NA78]|uniref:c-type cytochrome domain-containing protein n=1 Tax=Anatilimnocola sp. NA78 TaxID=3415683 RepID=UPI003CE457DC